MSAAQVRDPLGAGHDCAACGKTTQGHHAVHRDGMDLGPEVPICDECGGNETPRLPLLWKAIAARRGDVSSQRARRLTDKIHAIHEINAASGALS